jgi:3-hydroxyisobutyrate dehydrogenase
MKTMKTIAFIGLGNMGLPMTLNLLKAGHQVRAFDLSESALKKAVEQEALACKSAIEACENADILITMLPEGKHVRELVLGENGLLAHFQSSLLFMDCSTIDAETARDLHKACEEDDTLMLDAPVSGGVTAAEAGTLTFMCGGSESAFLMGKEILKDMGQNIFHAGPSGAGQVAKMCNNMLLAIHMIGTSEALKLGEKNGLDASVLSEIMLASSGKNWSLEKYNPYPGVMASSPASKGYKPGFMVDLMTKDLGLAMGNAENTGAQTPLGKLAYQLFSQKQQQGDGQQDFSSIIELLS